MNRRQFFKLLTATIITGAIASTIPIAVLAASDPRAMAWKLLEEARLLKEEGRSTVCMEKLEEFFTYLQANFLPPKPENFDADVLEVKTLLTNSANFDLGDCSDTTFCVAIVRHGLIHNKLPMIRAKGWKLFAYHLVPIVMTA